MSNFTSYLAVKWATCKKVIRLLLKSLVWVLMLINLKFWMVVTMLWQVVQVLSGLSGIVQQVIGAEVDPATPLMAAGLDSLASIEFRNSVSSKFGITLPVTMAFDYPNLDALSKFVHSQLPEVPGMTTTIRASQQNSFCTSNCDELSSSCKRSPGPLMLGVDTKKIRWLWMYSQNSAQHLLLMAVLLCAIWCQHALIDMSRWFCY